MAQAKGDIPIKEYYQDKNVVDRYLKERFLKPLRQIHHESQIEYVNDIIESLNPGSKVLEVSLGPARLTTEINVSTSCDRFALDFSWQMLEVATRRLIQENRYKYWHLINSDAFQLPFRDNTFDLIYIFRMIRHFELTERQMLYAEISRVLKNDGVLVFDAQNHDISNPHRLKEGLENYPVFDVLYKRDELIAELLNERWDVELQGVMCRFNLQELIQKILLKLRVNQKIIKKILLLLENKSDKNPSEWIVSCKRK